MMMALVALAVIAMVVRKRNSRSLLSATNLLYAFNAANINARAHTNSYALAYIYTYTLNCVDVCGLNAAY